MKKDKPLEIKKIQTSKRMMDGILFEQIYQPEEKNSCFIGWDYENNEEYIRDHLEESDYLWYVPIQDELIEKRAVILPSGILDYGTDEELEKEISDFIGAWLDISAEHQQKATWYVMLSWLIDRLHTIPYLRALGDYGTGKTRYLDVIGGLCYKPMFVGGAVKSAPIYRVIDLWRGTAIFDEFTLEKSDETQDIVQILNNGFQRGKPVLRCDSQNYDKVRAFDPFGAKILSTRSTFKDKALESRCITEIMKMTSKKNVPHDLTDEFYRKQDELQRKLLMYRFKNINEIKPDESVKIDFGNIMPRIRQTLAPFTVLFQHNEERLKAFVKYAMDYNTSIIEENSQSFDGQLVNFYMDAIEQKNMSVDTLDDYGKTEISVSDIKELMLNDGWKDESIKVSTIGRHYKALGFKTHVVRLGTKTKRILSIDDDDLNVLKMKYVVIADYGIDKKLNVTAVTDVTDTCGTTQKIL